MRLDSATGATYDPRVVTRATLRTRVAVVAAAVLLAVCTAGAATAQTSQPDVPVLPGPAPTGESRDNKGGDGDGKQPRRGKCKRKRKRGSPPASTCARDRNEIDLPNPGVSPPGANDPDCEPSSEHPFPVVLVHGTFGDMTVSWNLISPALVNEGYCVFALDYGERGTRDIPRSAKQLERFIDDVLEATDAKRVSIVGHSQGGMLPRHYIRFLGGRDEVEDLVGLAPSNHGTTVSLTPLASQAADCRACKQQIARSHFIKDLNAGGRETFKRIDYTVISTRLDEVVTPVKSQGLKGPKSRVTNIVLQDRCPLDVVEHLAIIYDPVALQWVLEALDRNGPARRHFKPVCV